MAGEPEQKRAVVFVDGQNLYFGAREAFGYTYPNYDVRALAQALCDLHGWELTAVNFYTGVPDETDNMRWNRFWSHKLAVMGRQGVYVYSRPLRYRNRRVHLPDGSEFTFLAGEEKGIDVRLAIDVIRKAHRQEFDVALIFSQDQDLSKVAKELRQIAQEQRRWIKVASRPSRAARLARIGGGLTKPTGSQSTGPPTTPASTGATIGRRTSRRERPSLDASTPAD